MTAPSDRRGFLRGLVSLPLIGGGVTLIGAPSAPVPLVQAAALPAFGDPLQRARYAWEAFALAMDEATVNAQGWRIVGAGNVRPMGYVTEGGPYLRLAEARYEEEVYPGAKRPLIVERHHEIDLHGMALARTDGGAP